MSKARLWGEHLAWMPSQRSLAWRVPVVNGPLFWQHGEPWGGPA